MCLVVSGSLREMSLHAMLKYGGTAALVKLFFTHSSFPCLLHSFRPYIRDTPGRARNVLHPGAFSMYPPGLVENESYKLTFTLTRCVVIDSYIYLVIFEPMPHWTSPCLLLPLLLSFLCQAGYVNGNPSGSRLGNRSKKPSWRSGFS